VLKSIRRFIEERRLCKTVTERFKSLLKGRSLLKQQRKLKENRWIIINDPVLE
jgi:hypothetical protein